MKITKDTLKQMIAEEMANEKGLKAKIRKAHKEEGGAAGMDALEKHTKASAKDIKAAVKDMDDVGQHKDGDYIQGDGKKIQIAKEQMSGEQKDWDKISQARLDGATDYREGRGMEDNADKWQEVDNGIYFTDYEDGFFDAQEAEDYELDEGIKENQEYDGEMANAGVVNEEDKCAKIRAKEEELFLMSKHYEVEGYEFESYQALQDARELRKANKECFPEDFKDKAPEPGKSGMNTGDFSQLYKESKKDLLKRIVAEELAKMEIEAVLKEEEGGSEIGESDFEDLLAAAKTGKVKIEYA